MASTTYHFEKISDAISNPKGDHARVIDWHIDFILDDHRDSNSIDAMKRIASKLTEYVNRNLNSKFETREYARQLVREWKNLCGEIY